MANIKQTTTRMRVLAEEHQRLPLLITQILNLLQLRPEEMRDLDAARCRSGFRLVLAEAVLVSLQKRSQFANIDKTAAALGDPILDDVKAAVDRVVSDFFKHAAKVEQSSSRSDGAKL